MMTPRVFRVALVGLFWTALTPAPAMAQTSTAAAASVTFGAWLDDASTLMRGMTNASVSVGRWSGLNGGETDGPVFDISTGVTSRLQLGASLPFYHARYTDGFTASGLGDTYLTAKYKVVNPDDKGWGVSVTPLLEILSNAELADPTLGLKRVNWAIPVSVQVGADKTQAFATAGYFSRGATFVGLGVSQALNDTVTFTGSMTVSHSTRDLSVTDLATLRRTRVDASGGVSVSFSKRVGFWGSIGRTVSTLDASGASFTGSASISVLLGTFHK